MKIVKIVVVCIYLLYSCFLNAETVSRSLPNYKSDNDEVESSFDEIKKTLGSVANVSSSNAKKDNMDFKADNVEYDFKNNIIIATGSVEIFLSPGYLRADKVFYNSELKYIYATGNIYYVNEFGDVVETDSLELDTELQKGIIENIKMKFQNFSTLKAKSLEKQDSDTYEAKDVSYSLCRLVEDTTPTWVIKASSGKYDAKNESIILYSTWLEMFSVPVAWSPFLYFSNLALEREWGFLAPTYKNSSLGGYIVVPFYMPIGDSQDILFNTNMFFMGNPNLYNVIYKGYAFDGKFNINASIVPDKKVIIDGKENKEWHFFMDVDKHINDTFKISSKLELISYPDYVNVYDINPKADSESFLNNNISLEGFYNNNNYSNFFIAGTKAINPSFSNDVYNQEMIFDYKYLGDTGKYGRFNLNAQQALFSFDNFSDKTVSRFFIGGEYTYNQMTDYLGNYNYSVNYNSNFYVFDKEKVSEMSDNYASNIALVLTWEYPTVVSFKNNYIATLSPTVQTMFSKNLDKNDNEILFDTGSKNVTSKNIFRYNQIGGNESFADESSVKIGINNVLLNDRNQGSRLFIGKIFDLVSTKDSESHRVKYKLEENSSYLASLDLYVVDGLDVSYEAIIDNNFDLVENLTELRLYNDLAFFSINYSYFGNLDQSVYNMESISEISMNTSINVSKNFSFKVQGLYDLSNNEKLKELNSSIAWKNDCLALEVYVKQNFYDNISNTLTYGFTIILPTAGQFSLEI